MQVLRNQRIVLLAVSIAGLTASAPAQELFFEDFQRFDLTRDFVFNDLGANSFWGYQGEPGAPDLEAVTPNRLTGQSQAIDGNNPWVLEDLVDGQDSPNVWQTGTISSGARTINTLGDTLVRKHSGDVANNTQELRALSGGQWYDDPPNYHGLRVKRGVDYSPLSSADTLVVEYMYYSAQDFRSADVFLQDHRQIGFSNVQPAIVSGEQNNRWTFWDAQGMSTVQAANLSPRGLAWTAVRAEYDLTANEGMGSASLFTKAHDELGNLLDAEWQPVPEMQDLPVNYTGNWEDLANVYLDVNGNTYANQLIDDIRITAIGDTPVGVAGDFNEDQMVNLADYTVWRDNLGSSTALPNDNDLGVPVGVAHYDVWKSSFSVTPAGVGIAVTAIPEPASVLLALLSWVGLCGAQRVSIQKTA